MKTRRGKGEEPLHVGRNGGGMVLRNKKHRWSRRYRAKGCGYTSTKSGAGDGEPGVGRDVDGQEAGTRKGGVGMSAAYGGRRWKVMQQ